jgi:hypothetical protein
MVPPCVLFILATNRMVRDRCQTAPMQPGRQRDLTAVRSPRLWFPAEKPQVCDRYEGLSLLKEKARHRSQLENKEKVSLSAQVRRSIRTQDLVPEDVPRLELDQAANKTSANC